MGGGRIARIICLVAWIRCGWIVYNWANIHQENKLHTHMCTSIIPHIHQLYHTHMHGFETEISKSLTCVNLHTYQFSTCEVAKREDPTHQHINLQNMHPYRKSWISTAASNSRTCSRISTADGHHLSRELALLLVVPSDRTSPSPCRPCSRGQSRRASA